MKRIFIMEDDPAYLEKEVSVIRSLMNHVDICFDSHQPCDLYLLDINGPVNGIELAEAIKTKNNKAKIIFVTNHDDYVFDALKTFPTYFVRKNITGELEYAIQKIREFWQEDCINAVVIDTKNVIELPLNRIIYIERQKSNYTIVTKEDCFHMQLTLTGFEKQNHKHFVRINHGVIINILKVRSMTNEYVEMINGTIHYFSRRRRKEAIKKILMAKER